MQSIAIIIAVKKPQLGIKPSVAALDELPNEEWI